MRRLIFLLPVVIFVVLAGFFLSQLFAGRDTSILPSALIDQPAPAFKLAAVTGIDTPGLQQGDLYGRVSLVNVFASWCIPCLAEHPLITRMAEDGITVYGINHRDTDAAATRWLKRHGNPYSRIGADHDARASLEWGITGVPETFIIDANGSIRFKHAGPITPEVLERGIMPVLNELTKAQAL